MYLAGETRAAALKNIQEAIEDYVESLKAHDEHVPPSISEEVVEVAMCAFCLGGYSELVVVV